MVEGNRRIRELQFLDGDKWEKQKTTNYDVSIEYKDGLKIKASQIRQDAPHTIVYYDNKTIFENEINSKYTYLLKVDGEASKSLQIQQVIVGYDQGQKQIFSVYNPLGSQMVVSFPEEAVSYSVGLRISGNGECDLKDFSLEEHEVSEEQSKRELIMQHEECEYLLITNTYPDKNNYYQNMFVHKRVKLYKEQGINVAVYRLNSSTGNIGYYEYEGIPVYLGGEKELTRLLNTKTFKKILFHFINERMYRAVNHSNAKSTPKLVWVHGFETTKWYRRWFNFSQDVSSIRTALKQSELNQKQLDFMHTIYTTKEDDIKFIFVSKWYKENVAEKDTNTIINNYSIIHNIIDNEIFNYIEKDAEQRKRILTIRPFASRVYANDLVVKAILELKDRPFFNELVFDIYGQGPLFQEVVEPVRNLSNVHLHNYFLSQEDIAKLHKSHGIFLGATRMDSQGVSLGEAMSSGLVPVTNGVYAIPEFVDETCGDLADNDDYLGLAKAIEHLYYNPQTFLEKSKNAAERIRKQCGMTKMVQAEINELQL